MYVTECANPHCGRMFRDAPDTAGVCPNCGHENGHDDEDTAYEERLKGLTW